MIPGQAFGTYRPSGRFSLLVFLWTPLVAVPVAAVTAAAYAYAILYIPLVGYFTFILTAGFGFLVGLGVRGGVRMGKARNPALAVVLGLAAGCVALYLSWVVWIFALARRGGADLPLVGLALQPAAVWELIRSVNAEGAWSIKGWTPTGGALWFFWAVEAVMVAGIPTLLGWTAAGEPYCEQCGSWCQETKGVFVGKDTPHPELIRRLRNQDLGFVAQVGPADPGAAARIRYDLHACGCGATFTLGATALTKTVEKGKEKEESKELVDKVLLRRDTAAALRALGGRPAPALTRSVG
jgi:hypothetical protein